MKILEYCPGYTVFRLIYDVKVLDVEGTNFKTSTNLFCENKNYKLYYFV